MKHLKTRKQFKRHSKRRVKRHGKGGSHSNASDSLPNIGSPVPNISRRRGLSSDSHEEASEIKDYMRMLTPPRKKTLSKTRKTRKTLTPSTKDKILLDAWAISAINIEEELEEAKKIPYVDPEYIKNLNKKLKYATNKTEQLERKIENKTRKHH